MSKCTASLDHFECFTDIALIIIVSGMDNTSGSVDPYPARLLMCITVL